MPNYLKRKLYHQAADATAQQLCDIVTRTMWIDKQCPREEEGHAFNELSSSRTDPAIINVIATMQTAQQDMAKQISNVTEKLQDKLSLKNPDRPQPQRENKRNSRQQQWSNQPNQKREFYPRNSGYQNPRQNSHQFQNQYQPPKRFRQPRPSYQPRNQFQPRPQYQNDQYRQRDSSPGRNSDIVCFNCGNQGHMQRECRYQKN